MKILLYLCIRKLNNKTMTETLRQVGDIQLIKGKLASEGLYNVFNVVTEELGFWFDDEVKDTFLNMTDDEFLDESRINFEITSFIDDTNT